MAFDNVDSEAARTDLGLLPNLIVIGAMKCGTTALHRYLDLHPDVAMSEPKELNFFIGPERLAEGCEPPAWLAGNWHRGLEWYARQFRPAPVRGEASPGYTSPSSPEAPERMARVLPGARLVYAVRDPVERAVSQYLHHRADGTERRPIEEALLDPSSQYVERGLYHARLEPYLKRFPPRADLYLCARRPPFGSARDPAPALPVRGRGRLVLGNRTRPPLERRPPRAGRIGWGTAPAARRAVPGRRRSPPGGGRTGLCGLAALRTSVAPAPHPRAHTRRGIVTGERPDLFRTGATCRTGRVNGVRGSIPSATPEGPRTHSVPKRVLNLQFAVRKREICWAFLHSGRKASRMRRCSRRST